MSALATLARRYGTPLYVYCADTVRGRYRALRGAFTRPVLVCYALKANSNKAVASVLARGGRGRRHRLRRGAVSRAGRRLQTRAHRVSPASERRRRDGRRPARRREGLQRRVLRRADALARRGPSEKKGAGLHTPQSRHRRGDSSSHHHGARREQVRRGGRSSPRLVPPRGPRLAPSRRGHPMPHRIANHLASTLQPRRAIAGGLVASHKEQGIALDFADMGGDWASPTKTRRRSTPKTSP